MGRSRSSSARRDEDKPFEAAHSHIIPAPHPHLQASLTLNSCRFILLEAISPQKSMHLRSPFKGLPRFNARAMDAAYVALAPLRSASASPQQAGGPSHGLAVGLRATIKAVVIDIQ